MATHIINDNLFLKVSKKEAFKAKKAMSMCTAVIS